MRSLDRWSYQGVDDGRDSFRTTATSTALPAEPPPPTASAVGPSAAASTASTHSSTATAPVTVNTSHTVRRVLAPSSTTYMNARVRGVSGRTGAPGTSAGAPGLAGPGWAGATCTGAVRLRKLVMPFLWRGSSAPTAKKIFLETVGALQLLLGRQGRMLPSEVEVAAPTAVRGSQPAVPS
jgi:hypothetical protein